VIYILYVCFNLYSNHIRYYKVVLGYYFGVLKMREYRNKIKIRVKTMLGEKKGTKWDFVQKGGYH